MISFLKRQKKIFIFGLSLIFLACSGPSQKRAQEQDANPIPEDKLVWNSTGVKGGKLILPSEGNPKTFNPYLVSDVPASKIKSDMHEALTDLYLSTMGRMNKLAKSHEVSEDGLIHTYKIRKGLRWSDGHPFTIDDVMFSFQVVYDPKILTSDKDIAKQSDGSLPQFEKIDEERIRFTLKEVNVMFDSAIGATPIIPKHKWEKIYKAGDFMNAMLINTPPEDLVGMGPYVLEKFVSDQRVVFKRNPHFYYFDKAGQRLPYFDQVIRVITSDYSATLLKFQNGETDMHEIRPEEYDLLKREEKQGDYTITDLGPALMTYYLHFNLNPRKSKEGRPFLDPKKLKVFSDKRFRQAISYSIDREGIVKTVFHGRALPIYGFTSPGNKDWFNPKIKKYPFDLEKAKTLLQEMGLKDSDGDGYLEYEDGSVLQFSIKTNSENHSRIQIANTIKEDFKKIGVKAILQPVPFNNLITTLDDIFDYDAVILGWGSGVPPDPAMGKNILLSSGRLHHWNPMQKTPATPWEKEIDELMVKNLATEDMSERKKYYDRVQEIWAEELPQIMILSPNLYVAIKNKIGNTKPVVHRPYHEWNKFELYDKSLEK